MSGKNLLKHIFIVMTLHQCFNFSDSGRIKRIVGGTPVMCDEKPRVVSLRNSSSNLHLCGATIINPDFALTAAHCVRGDADQYILQLNNICVEKNSPYPEAKVEKIYTHELYNKYSRAHDLAILQIRLALDDVTWLNDSVLPTSSFGLSGIIAVT
ncbi:hypothetical protein evm_003812 [Chilo suppressalis]|nr:hypothetical protein evm_003812 [Chilo suppressalis]